MTIEAYPQVDERTPASDFRAGLSIKPTACAESGCDYCRGPETD